MRIEPRHYFAVIGMGIALGVAGATMPATAGELPMPDEPRLAEYFGFLPLEIYKLDPRIAGLLLADLDGDGVKDVIVANNGRSRIDMLLSRSEGAGDEKAAAVEANQVPGDRRMRLVSLPVNKEIVSLQAGDFDGDGKTDLAYYGNPAELTIRPNLGDGKFGDARRINSGEAIESLTTLTVGDLNRDGKADMALLAPNEVIVILQKADGTTDEPLRLPHTAASPGLLRAVDLDGDGGDDLVLLDSNADDPIRVRFGTADGKLGPEQRFDIESPRAIAFAALDANPGVELLTVEQTSGRARAFTLADADESEGRGAGSSAKRGRLIFHPLPRGESRDRSIAVGDLDGDGKADVVVSDPANAQFLVYLQGEEGLGAPQTFPNLSDGSTVRVADLDGDGKAEVVVLSKKEKQIALSSLAGGRLSFPTPLPTGGDPVALEVADLDGDGRPEILYAIAGTEPQTWSLRGLRREASGTFVPFRWGQEESATIKGASSPPPALRVVEVNGDGQPDILVFADFGPPTLLLGRAGEAPAPTGGSPGPLVDATPSGVGPSARGGPGLIVAQNTYARDVALGASGRWEVLDQYNSGRNAAQIVGAAAIDADDDGTPEIVLLDRNAKNLIFLDRREGVYRPGGTLSLGPIDFRGMHVADLDGDGRDDLLVAGTDRFAVVLTGRSGRWLKPLAGYESRRQEAVLADLAAGDLNGDGRPDIAMIDTAEHFVEIATYRNQPTPALDRALSFKIFEKKSFRDPDRLVEPRDLGIGDVDGDGRADLVLIVHDRILIYRQDAGKPRKTPPADPTAPSPSR